MFSPSSRKCCPANKASADRQSQQDQKGGPGPPPLLQLAQTCVLSDGIHQASRKLWGASSFSLGGSPGQLSVALGVQRAAGGAGLTAGSSVPSMAEEMVVVRLPKDLLTAHIRLPSSHVPLGFQRSALPTAGQHTQALQPRSPQQEIKAIQIKPRTYEMAAVLIDWFGCHLSRSVINGHAATVPVGAGDPQPPPS